jgi:hypothetical protein
VSERTREAPQAVSETESSETVPRSRDPKRLLELIRNAQGSEGKRRKAYAGEINEVLIAMRAPGNEAAEAKAILSQLDLKTLDDLEDDQARFCHTEAVETLLACGFPHALSVKPEDLSAHVEDRLQEGRSKQLAKWMPMMNLLVMGLIPLLATLGAFGTTHRSDIRMGLVLTIAAVWTGLALRARRRRRKRAKDA